MAGKLRTLLAPVAGLAVLLTPACAGPDSAKNGLLVDVKGFFERVARISPDHADRLRAALREDPMVYFRMINVVWANAVCDAFSEEAPEMPAVWLHGDAHLEQYALNVKEHGLDDFDDSVSGPAVLDIVRFLGSVEIAIRRFGWEAERDSLFGRFFEGYRRGLEEPGYMPPEPAIVARMRSSNTRSKAEFLAWAESIMERFPRSEDESLRAGFRRFSEVLFRLRPEFPAHYLDLKEYGLARIGIGSAVTPKILLRIEGMTRDPLDDLIVEAKELSDVSPIRCVSLPVTGEVYRVIAGSEHMGRLTHEIMAIVPRREGFTVNLRDVWVRSWEPSFQEISLNEYRSPRELAEVIYDAGVQLGGGQIKHAGESLTAQMRLAQERLIGKLDPKIRRVAIETTERMLDAWRIAREVQ